MTKAETIINKLAALDLGTMVKKYVVPSAIIGPAIGAGITAAISENKEQFKKNVGKGMGVGFAADVLTGVGMGMWNKHFHGAL